MLTKAFLPSIIFLPAILTVGFITSYEDFKTSKIKNTWIASGLIYSFLVYLLIWILYLPVLRNNLCPGARDIYLLLRNFDKWCINFVISTAVAYLLWHLKMWGAGDAKLFICYAALIPVNQYSKVYFDYYFASFFLLLAVFLPATVFLFLRSVIYLLKRLTWHKARESIYKSLKERLAKLKALEIAKVILGFFVFFLFFGVLNQGLSNLLSKFLVKQNILLLVSILAFKQLSKFFKQNTRSMFIALVILIAYIIFVAMHAGERLFLEIAGTLGKTLSVMIMFPFFKKVVDLYVERTEQKTTPFAIWMFLGALITWFF